MLPVCRIFLHNLKAYLFSSCCDLFGPVPHPEPGGADLLLHVVVHVPVGPRVLVALQGRVGGEELACGCAAAGDEDGEAVPVQLVGRVVLEYKGDILDREEEGNIRTRG